MRSLIRLTDHTKEELEEIFHIADTIEDYAGFLAGKTIVTFFPATGIRTRVSFEKGIFLLGGQCILFDPATLDKKEDLRDVCGYLSNWADALVIRHRDIHKLEVMAKASDLPVINAMTDDNHPCEILTDLYALSKRRADYLQAKYVFVGADGNIGRAWKEASDVFGFSLTQCCPPRYRMPEVPYEEDLRKAVAGKDIICTDGIPSGALAEFEAYQVTKEIMDLAGKGALLNPCPPFYRGEEVSADAIDSVYFVGYAFKKDLLRVQQAVLVYCLLQES